MAKLAPDGLGAIAIAVCLYWVPVPDSTLLVGAVVLGNLSKERGFVERLTRIVLARL